MLAKHKAEVFGEGKQCNCLVAAQWEGEAAWEFWQPDGEKEHTTFRWPWCLSKGWKPFISGCFGYSKIETDLNQSILAGTGSISMGRPKEFQGFRAAQRPELPLISLVPGGAKELGMVYFRNQRVQKISQITYQFIEFEVKASVSWLLLPATWIGHGVIQFATYFTTEMTWHQTQRGSTNVNVLVVIIEHLQFIGKAYEILICIEIPAMNYGYSAVARAVYAVSKMCFKSPACPFRHDLDCDSTVERYLQWGESSADGLEIMIDSRFL